ncbi:MAG TPA: L,D-transpeptidase family protein [Kofleriaceae bacterium]|nr:L,D-transpeptidase family protein [Kofleriaceae bacterium]
MRLALVVALAACGRSEPTPVVEPAPPPPVHAADAAVAAPVIPAGARELIVGLVDDWDTTAATLRRYRRDGTAWTPVGEPWPAVVGKAGTAWGSGLHGRGAPAGRTGPVKQEGDGKSPAGVFALADSYGYAKQAPTGTQLRYTAVDDAWKCVDDPASRVYNRIVDQRSVGEVDWKSAEDMRRHDELYTWVVDVAHNAARAPGGGSCIFLHVWRGPGSATTGCTAMAEPKVKELVATLDPSAVYVLLPRPEYDALKASWALP